MTETTWLWVGFIGMAIGSVVLLVQMDRKTTGGEAHGVIHGLVTATAAAFYLLMALDQGGIIIDHGREFLWARYADWSITTPLLLTALALTALEDLRKRLGLVVALLGADIYMILTGFAAGASPTSSPEKWIWFLVSCGAFLAVYWVIWGPLRAEAERAGKGTVYRRDAAILSGLWLLYPVVFLCGTDGLLLVSPALAALGFTLLDLLSKVGFGILTTAESNDKQRRAVGDARRSLPQT